jgi:predicted ATPase
MFRVCNAKPVAIGIEQFSAQAGIQRKQAKCMEKITGSELVKRVLKDPHGSIEKLLQLSSRTESDWLELKAATLPEYVVENGTRRYLRKKDENDADHAWLVAKAIVAMANTHGGAVILGIDNYFNGVGLEASDKKGDLAKGQDNFARCVLDTVLRPEKCCWKCGKETYELTVTTYYELLEYQFADYQDKRVAVIVVNPVPKNGKLILVEETRKFRETLLVRAVGEEGRVRKLFRNRDIEEYGVHRDPRQESYTLLHDQFLASCPKPDQQEHSEPEGLTEAVNQYHDLLRQMCAQDDRLFIPLDAEENSSVQTDMELFEPMAEEYLSSDLDWLDESEEDVETRPSLRRKPDESNDETDFEDQDEDEGDSEDLDELTRIARKGGVFSLLEQEPRAMLLGEPGGGKTTCLKHLALRAANRFSEDKRVSLFVPLSRYKGAGDLMPLMVRATRSSKTEAGLTLVHVEWLMKYGRLQLLLDALNECPSEYTLHCMEDIQSCLNRYPSLSVTITARTYAYREQIGLPAFAVQPMDANQQREFLAVHLQSKSHAQEIMAQLQQQPGGKTLSPNPLLLRLVVEAVRGGQPLPKGRARLYRQFLERWYIREAIKAKNAGCPLPWTMDQTFSALSQMAFQTRLAGLRSIPRNQAIEFLQDVISDPNMFIDRMAQGLVLTCDFEEVIDFLHETFQEYLAAEFLIQNPEYIVHIEKSETEKWSMTLAYLFELMPEPPKDFVIAAWHREPLLVAASLQKDSLLRQLPINEKTWSPWLCGILKALRGEEVPETEALAQRFRYTPDQALVLQLRSQPLWYAFSTHETGRRREQELLKWIISNDEPWIELLPAACQGNPEWIIRIRSELPLRPLQLHYLFSYIDKQAVDRSLFCHNIRELSIDWILRLIKSHFIQTAGIPKDKHDQIIRDMNAEQASWLIRRRVIRSRDISIQKRQQIIREMNAKQAGRMAQDGFISRKDIDVEKWSSFIKEMGPGTSVLFAATGLIIPEEIPQDRLKELQNMMTISEAISAVHYGLYPKDKIKQLIQEISANQAIWLVQRGVICPEDIPEDKRRQFIKDMNAKEADWLVKYAIIRPKEIPEEKRKQFIQEMNAERTIWLVKQGIIHPEDIPEEKQKELIQDMSAKEADWLVRLGVIRSEDKRKQFIQDMNVEPTGLLLQQGAIHLEDIPEEKRKQLIQEMNAEQARRLVRQGIIRPEDIPEEKRKQLIQEMNAEQANWFVKHGVIHSKELIQEMNAEQADWLVHHGVIGPENIPEEKRQQFIQEMNAERARWLVGQHIIRPEEIPEDKRKELIQEMNVEQARWLVRQGVIHAEDVPEEKRNELVEKMNAEQAYCFLVDNVIKIDDISEEKRRSICNGIKAQTFCDLASVGLISAENLSLTLRQQLITEMNAKETAWLLKNGFISLGDIQADKCQSLLEDASIGERQILSRVGLVANKEVLNEQDHQVELGKEAPECFTKNQIQRKTEREIISKKLSGYLWELAVVHLIQPHGTSGFAGHPSFAENIYFQSGRLDIDRKDPLKIGDVLKAEVTIILNKRRQEWNFAVAHGFRLKQAKSETHRWEKAWSHFAPRFFLAAKKQFKFTSKDFDKIREEGFDTTRLEAWQPTEHDGQRLATAMNSINYLTSPSQISRIIADKGIYKERLNASLVGEGPWASMRKLAEAYVDGKRLEAKIKIRPTLKDPVLRIRRKKPECAVSSPSFLTTAPSISSQSIDHESLSDCRGILHLPVPLLEEWLSKNRELEDFQSLWKPIGETGVKEISSDILNKLKLQMAEHPELQRDFLQAIENYYSNKIRDLEQLRKLFAATRALLPTIPSYAGDQVRLLWYLLALQDANHDGDPERIQETATNYANERESLKQSDPELCAYADLNLAVHYADSFEFAHAEVTVGKWVYDPLFRGLPRHHQGRIWSALGQYKAMQHDPFAADFFFSKALKLFDKANLSEAETDAEKDQTGIYQAISALDGNMQKARQLVEATVGPLNDVTVRKYALDSSTAGQYRHHLLLRALIMFGAETKKERAVYHLHQREWQEGQLQHPWPLIHGYRAMLLCAEEEQTEELAQSAVMWFDRAIAVSRMECHGATVRLIGAMVATIAACAFADRRYEQQARDLLQAARGALPAAMFVIKGLEEILADPSPEKADQAMSLLPFNYH